MSTYTADLEVQYEADTDEIAGAVLVALVRSLNATELAEDIHVESFLLLRGEQALEVDVVVKEAARKTRTAKLYALRTPQKSSSD